MAKGGYETTRASADALLAAAEREGRGRLRLFLGAAPGVGKTYAMLQAAKAAKAGGVDVAIGIVETHGRADTQALIGDLEILPRAGIPYRGRLVQEFDVEGAIRRRPALLLVDEYAHSNVDGSRHPKRWQDVQDCIAAGINVWTTMNVQHVESLNDVVQRITGVRVRETVPDTSLQKADEIVLVDLPSDELIRRMAEGKVYVENTATRAMQNFFKPSNLTALRELALRKVAARIDSDLVDRMQGGAIAGPWAAGERLLVCIGPDSSSERLVREAKRLADLLDASWFAVSIEQPGTTMSEPSRKRLDQAMRFAKNLGAETVHLVGSDFPAEILRFARFENVTQIVVGKAKAKSVVQRLSGWGFGPTLADALVGHADGVSIHVLTGIEGTRRRGFPWPPVGPMMGYLTSVATVTSSVLLGSAMSRVVALPNVSMLFLLAVLIPALSFGVWPAVFASALSFAAYNFFFLDPLYTFTIARPHEFLALAIFLIIAVLISTVAGRARDQTRMAAQRTRAARRLFEFTRTLSALPEAQGVAEAATNEVYGAIKRACVILVPDETGLVIAAAWPPEDRLDLPSQMAATWALDHDEPAGAETGTLPSVPWLFLPLSAPDRKIGVLGIEKAIGAPSLDVESRTLLETLTEQTAAALLRTALSTEVRSALVATENERVRNILLASISHDFRTPLASILGAATGILDVGERMDADARRDLLLQIRDEARHLDGMVRNLLSMMRLESGGLDLRRDWIDIGDSLDRAVDVARRRGATQAFEVKAAEGLPLVFADQSLLDQAIGNVVANAVRYAGSAARVELAAAVEDDRMTIRIADDGPGVAEDLADHVFDKFARAATAGVGSGDSAGLGLAIARGIMEAHGGEALLEPRSPLGGASFALRLPLDARNGT